MASTNEEVKVGKISRLSLFCFTIYDAVKGVVGSVFISFVVEFKSAGKGGQTRVSGNVTKRLNLKINSSRRPFHGVVVSTSTKSKKNQQYPDLEAIEGEERYE